MKNPIRKLIFAILFTAPISAAQAQIFPALTVFDGSAGVLKVPTLLFEGKLYYLELSVADLSTLTLKIEAESLVDITPNGSTTGKVANDIVGTWDVEGEATQITFNGDGTWVLSQAAGDDTESCPDGGDETGTFRFNPLTGVLIPVFLSDENGDCGFSGVNAAIRFFPDGNVMTLLIGNEEEATNLTLVP